ncbi:hypothetical protein AGMMS4956_07490 [Bacteroidia bacterium]|nr:hypothetical protein AGMMS4956_07490 [Bacteroidia bacterium]
MVIILVGLVASLCWLGSLYGYYSWLKSWTQILWLHEEQFLKKKAEQEGKKPDSIDDKLRVYSLVYKEAVKKHGYSTQKITKVFIASAIMAWLYLLTHTIYKCLLPYIKIPYCDVGTCSIIIIGILAFVILAVIVWCYSQTLLSDTKPMYKLCIKDKQYEVNPPKNKIFNPLNS